MDSSHDDLSLLRRFVDHRDESAFRALVDRHLNRVYAVAMRKTGDHHTAQDVAQEVFAILARRARKLRPDTILVAWLHRVATTESAEALRGEYRRRRTMAEYMNEVKTDSESRDATSVPEIFSILDEAIEALPVDDRNALLLRFISGQRFRELGDTLGKSEEASRKQVSRAIKKLSAILHRKGIAVSATALSATFALPSFAQAAPAGLAAAISTTAIAAGSLPIQLQILTVMAQAKTKIVLVTATVLLVGATSFVAGRHNAADFALALSKTTPPPTARPVLAIGRAPASAERPAPGARARTILERAATIFRGRGSKTLAYYEGLLVLHELKQGDIPDALEFLESVSEDEALNGRMAPIIMGIWAKRDGAAAMGYAETRFRGHAFSKSCEKILEPWARQDPEGAYEWFRDRDESGDVGMNISTFRWLATKLFQGWVEADHEAALTTLTGVPVEDERAAIYGIARARSRSLDPAPILASIGRMPEGAIKGKVVGEVSKRWAREEPQAAAAWLDTVEGLSPRNRFHAKVEVAEEWLRSDRSELPKISAWLLAGASDEFRGAILDGLAKERSKDNKADK